MKEVRISPDGNAVAIRTDFPEGSWNEWGVMTSNNGGHMADAIEVADWPELAEPTKTAIKAARDRVGS